MITLADLEKLSPHEVCSLWDEALKREVARLAASGARVDGSIRALDQGEHANRRALAVGNLTRDEPELHREYLRAFNALGAPGCRKSRR